MTETGLKWVGLAATEDCSVVAGGGWGLEWDGLVVVVVVVVV
jgi:hypothetical protein